MEDSVWFQWQQAWNTLDNDDEKQTLAEDEEFANLKTIAMKNLNESRKTGADSQRIKREHTDVVDYSGPKIPDNLEITTDYVKSLIHYFNEGKHLPYVEAQKLVECIKSYLVEEASVMNEFTIPENGQFVVVGDIHGQLPDLETVLDKAGEPSETNVILFNGDMVDRGPHGTEVLFTIYAMKLAYKQSVWINRGNHEIRRMNEKYSFEEQIFKHYDLELFDKIIETFDWLPLSTLVDGKIFVVHGGLFQYPDVTIDELRNLESERGKNPDRRKRLKTRSEFIVDNILWSDPTTEKSDWSASSRGAGIVFGSGVVRQFLETNDISIVVRSHQLVAEGFEFLFDNTFLTIFSCSNYIQKNTNSGAIAIFKHGADYNQPIIEQYKAYIVGNLKDTQADCMRETINEINERIYSERSSLSLEFSKIAENGYVSEAQWAEVLDSVLDLTLPWHILSPYIAKVNKDGNINYTQFLSSFKMLAEEAYSKQLMEQICARLFFSGSELTIQDLFSQYDTDGDGTISNEEFMSALKQYELGVDDDILYDFMRTFDSNSDGIIDYKEFEARFQVQLEIQAAGGEENWLRNIIKEIGIEMSKKSRSLTRAFKSYDKNHDNRIVFPEFVQMMKKDFGGSKYSQDELKSLFDAVDTNLSGSISVHEFRDAFRVIDTEGGNWQVSVIQKMCDYIRKSKTKLLSVFRSIDIDASGQIDLEEFTAGLEAMNILVDSPLSEDQIALLFNVIDRDGSGEIDYQEFIDAFRVIQINGSGVTV